MSELSSSDEENGRYVRMPIKRRRKNISESEMDKIVAKKVSEIIKQNNDLLYNTSNAKNIGKADLVPLFDPENSEISSVNWLHKIEQIGLINNWNEATKSFCMQSRLAGLGKVWYNGLSNYDLSWLEWKEAVIHAFPSHTDYAELLKQMLNRHKIKTESMMHYFYSKNMLIKNCGLNGTNAVSCLIDGLPIDMQGNAKAGNYQTPDDLFYGFLSKAESSNKWDKDTKLTNIPSEFRCHNCRKFGHKARHCTLKKFGSVGTSRGNSSVAAINCAACGKGGHSQQDCWTRTKIKCTSCGKTGHHEDKCWTKPSTSSSCSNCGRRGHSEGKCWFKDDRKVKDVRKLQGQELNFIYNILVSINGQDFNGYLDTGSQVNVAHISVAKQLKLNLNKCNIYIRGFGNSLILPDGMCTLKVNVGKVSIVTPIIFVSVDMNKYDIIIGQPVINANDVTLTVKGDKVDLYSNKNPNKMINCAFVQNYVFKIPIKVYDHVHILGNAVKRVLVYLDNIEDVIFVPSGIVSVNDQIFNVQGSLLSGPIQTLNIINLSRKPICLEKDLLLTRGIQLSIPKKINIIEEISDPTIFSLKIDHIRSGNLNTIDRSSLFNLLQEFKDCFACDTLELGKHSSVELNINLSSQNPVTHRPYRLSEFERNIVREKVDDLLEGGIIRESCSNFSSPVVLVKKKTGDFRLCVDYRKLNSITIKDKYPLPHIEDLINKLRGKKYFTSLDMAQGYYQVPVASDSIHKTAFVTPDGEYEFLRMPFGLANAPATFQRMINNILGKLRFDKVIAYLDDILIPSNSIEEGLGTLKEVLQLIFQENLKLNIDKCSFLQPSISFLGYEISEEGIRPGDQKIKAVADFKIPSNVHELRQFLGLSSYFRKFIKDHAKIVSPLTVLLRKNVPWSWGIDQTNAVNFIKDKLISKPILKIFNSLEKTELHTDASSKGIAGILMQYEGKELKPVSYFSRATSRDESLYHSYDLETLAVVESIKRFRIYLFGIHFKIITDCSAVRSTFEKKDILPRVARWWLSIQEYDFEIEHRPGEKIKHVDALSRNPVSNVLLIDTVDWILTLQMQDEQIRLIKRKLDEANDRDILNTYSLKNDKLYRKVLNGKYKLVLPKSARFNLLRKYHDEIGHVGLERCLTLIKEKFWFKNMNKFVKKYVSSCLDCHYKRGNYGKQEGYLFPIDKPREPLHTWHIDHLGPFSKSHKGNSYILVIVDSFAKFVFARACKTVGAQEVVDHLADLFSMFGTPKRIISDRGKAFTSTKFKSFTTAYQVKHILNAVSSPRSNGQVERYNRTILDGLNTSVNNENEWQKSLPNVIWGINNTINKSTGFTPHLLMFGYNKNRHADIGDDEFDIPNDIQLKAKDSMDRQARKMKERFDAKRKPCKTYEVGDLVLWSGADKNDKKISRKVGYYKFGGPYKVFKTIGNDRYEIVAIEGMKGYKRFKAAVAGDTLRKYKGGIVEETESDSSVDSTDELIDLLEG